MIIYKITNDLNDKVYIGQTIKSLEHRWQVHLKSKDNFKIHAAMRSYGSEHFHIEQIDSASSIEELNQKEIYWINYYDSYNNGYNSTLGGETNPMSCEQVQIKHRNTMRSEEVRKKISETMKKYRSEHPFSEETRKKISEKSLGNQKFKGKKRTLEAIQKTSQSLHKKVYCIDLQGNIVKEFNSLVEADFWWYENGYNTVKNPKGLSDMIKRSYDKDIYIKGLKWIYKSV